MHNNRPVAIVIATLIGSVVLFAGPARPDELRLQFQVKDVFTPADRKEAPDVRPGKDKPVPPDGAADDATKPKTVNAKGTVGLGGEYFYDESSEVRTYFDFAKRRIITLHLADKTYEDESIYHVIAFRRAEFENQQFLAKMLGAAELTGRENPFQNSFEQETRFSIRPLDAKKLEMEEIADGTTVKFVVADRPVVECEYDDELIPRELRGTWAKFIIYRHSLHPEIRGRLLESGRLPKRLTYRYGDLLGSHEVTLTLQDHSLNAAGERPGVPDGFALRRDDDNELEQIIHDVRSNKTRLPAVTKEQAVGRAQQAYAQKDYLASLLVVIEYNLQTGETLPNEVMNLQPLFQTDDRLKQYFAANNRVSPEDADSAIAGFEKIDRTGLASDHVIDIMMAVAKMLKNDMPGAKELYLKALRKNPHLAGVYHDLGGIYHNEFNTQTAWRCWETAHAIAPNHPILQPVRQYEERLAKDFPEYFE